MKRRRLGWPPNSSVKRAMAHAREIERAIAEADRPVTRRCEAKPNEPRTINGSCLHCTARAGEPCRDKTEDRATQ